MWGCCGLYEKREQCSQCERCKEKATTGAVQFTNMDENQTEHTSWMRHDHRAVKCVGEVDQVFFYDVPVCRQAVEVKWKYSIDELKKCIDRRLSEHEVDWRSTCGRPEPL